MHIPLLWCKKSIVYQQVIGVIKPYLFIKFHASKHSGKRVTQTCIPYFNVRVKIVFCGVGDIVFTISGRFCQADPFQNFQIYNDAYLRYIIIYGFRHRLGNTHVAVTCCQSKAHICRRIIGTCTQYCIHTYSVHVCRLLSSHFPHDYFITWTSICLLPARH